MMVTIYTVETEETRLHHKAPDLYIDHLPPLGELDYAVKYRAKRIEEVRLKKIAKDGTTRLLTDKGEQIIINSTFEPDIVLVFLSNCQGIGYLKSLELTPILDKDESPCYAAQVLRTIKTGEEK